MFRPVIILHTAIAIVATVYLTHFWNKDDNPSVRNPIKKAILQSFRQSCRYTVSPSPNNISTLENDNATQPPHRHYAPLTVVSVGLVSTAILYGAVVFGTALNRRAAIRHDYVCNRNSVDETSTDAECFIEGTILIGAGILVICVLMFAMPTYIIWILVMYLETYTRCQPQLAVLASWAFVLILCAFDFTVHIMPRMNRRIEDIRECRRMDTLGQLSVRQALKEATSPIYKSTTLPTTINNLYTTNKKEYRMITIRQNRRILS